MKDVVPRQILDILGRLQHHGYDAFIVGGAVRDYLLGLPPKDYDIATSATPEQVKSVFRRRARIIGRRFRIVHVYDELGDICEVSTFRRTPDAEERKDRPDDDGVQVWNDNHYGTIEEDAWRRDFSVNALYYDPFREDGLFDFVDGRRDIESRVVRALGDPDERIQEDPVRILRALKLVGQFDFSLEPGLDRAVRRYAPAIDTVSKARLFEELRKIFVRNYSLKTFQSFRDHGFLHHFWPEMGRMWDTPPGGHLQALLAERDRRVAIPDYTMSKSLAVATLALPHVMARLRIAGLDGPLWMMDSETAILVRNAIQEFFDPLPVPRFLVSRASEIILLLPRFRDGIRPQRLVRHPEYKYARELFLLVCQVEGWPPEMCDRWPASGDGEPTFDNAVDESDGDWEEVGEVARIHMAAEAGHHPKAGRTDSPDQDASGPDAGTSPAKKKKRRRRGGRRRKGAPPAAGGTGSPAAGDSQGAGG
jgi:poly(A) polymerase